MKAELEKGGVKVKRNNRERTRKMHREWYIGISRESEIEIGKGWWGRVRWEVRVRMQIWGWAGNL